MSIPVSTMGIIGGVIASASLTSRSRKIEQVISDILELHLDIKEKRKQNEKA